MLLTRVPCIGHHDKDNCFSVLSLFLDTNSSSCLGAVPSLFEAGFIKLDPFSDVRLLDLVLIIWCCHPHTYCSLFLSH